MSWPESLSARNFELQFATDHLADFLLFHFLKPPFLSANAPRVIFLASAGHRDSSLHPTNYNLLHGVYTPFVAYGQYKTANVLVSNEIERRHGARGLHAGSVHAGIIFETVTSRHQGGADGVIEV